MAMAEAEHMQRLEELHAQGVLSDVEFANAKQRLEQGGVEAERLQRLEELHADGVLSESVFASAKERLQEGSLEPAKADLAEGRDGESSPPAPDEQPNAASSGSTAPSESAAPSAGPVGEPAWVGIAFALLVVGTILWNSCGPSGASGEAQTSSLSVDVQGFECFPDGCMAGITAKNVGEEPQQVYPSTFRLVGSAAKSSRLNTTRISQSS